MKSIACAVACFLALLGSVPGRAAATSRHEAKATTHVNVMLDWVPNAVHSGLYIAITRGYMKAAGFDVSIQVPSNTSDPAKLVGAGSVMFADADIGDIVQARGVGVPITAVMALTQHPLNGILTLKSSHISHPAQLAGHTVGISGDPADYAILDSMILADHGNPKSVKVVTLGTSTQAALMAHRVDGVIGFWSDEGVSLRMKGFGVNVMRVDSYGVPYSNELSVVASTKTTTHNPGLVRRFVAAWSKGQSYAVSHPVAAIRALTSQAKGVDYNINLHQLRALAPVMRNGAGRVGTLQAGTWQSYVNWLFQHKLLKHRFQVTSSVVTNKYLP